MVWYKKAADKGHTMALNNIGWLYGQGKGVNVDHNEAMVWYKKAADKGHAAAMNSIGSLYGLGKGVNMDYKDAMRWFKMAASNGSAWGCYNVGFYYQHGYGVETNQNQAFQFYQNAANLGLSRAQCKLGHAYRNGLGVAIDITKSLQWYTESAKGSDDLAQLQLGIAYMNGFGVTEDYVKAMEWFTQSKLYQSKLCLGYVYENGLGVKRNRIKAKRYFVENEYSMLDLGMTYLKIKEGAKSSKLAFYWFEKATKKNNLQAMLCAGCMYLTGVIDGGRNIEQAYSHLVKAARIGQVQLTMNQLKSPQNLTEQVGNDFSTMKWYFKTSDDNKTVVKECISGLSCVRYLYHKGIGVRQSFSKAREMYQTVLQEIDEDDTDANLFLGLLYSKGLGVDRDDEKAMKFFSKSAKRVNTYAYNVIGDAYKHGNGVENDDLKALEWYMKGSVYNDGYSQLNIGKIYTDANALYWFIKSHENGCKEAEEYLKSDADKGCSNTNTHMVVESEVKEAAEIRLQEVIAELARVDPENKVLRKVDTSVDISYDVKKEEKPPNVPF